MDAPAERMETGRISELPELKRDFTELTGIIPPPPKKPKDITKSASVIVELEVKLREGTTDPNDVKPATYATSYLLWRCEQHHRAIAFPTLSKGRIVGNPELAAQEHLGINGLQQQLDAGNLPTQKAEHLQARIKDLKNRLYLHDPAFGAESAMEVLRKIYQIHPKIPLSANKEGRLLVFGAPR